jgi:hypothetical protein
MQFVFPGSTDLSGIHAVQWGIEHERTALQCYADATGNIVEASGIWFDPSGCLGATPDGLVGSDIIVEFKCPYRARDTSFDAIMDKDNKFFISKTPNGLLELNSDHDYYHQIQGQMHITKRTECHFVVWSPKEALIFFCQRDDQWAVNMTKLHSFYDAILLPRLFSEYFTEQ